MKKYTEIKTFEDACGVLELDAKKAVVCLTDYLGNDTKSIVAYAKLIIVVRAANKLANNGTEWTPDFSNWKERKYEPWFDLEEGSSGFRYDDYDHWLTGSYVGSRLCFISREVCEYVANQFLDLYKEYFL